MKRSKKLLVRGHVFYVDEKVYEPAEDTFLIVENLKVEEKEVVLDLGTGCGILAVLAAKQAKKVVATDINPFAIKCAKKNAKMNCVEDKIEFRRGDLFQPIRPNETFSLILFNAPYLPCQSYEERTWVGKSWAGGLNGRKVIDRFISNASEFLTSDGKILLVQSSLSDIDQTLDILGKSGLEARVVAKVEFPYERIALIEARAHTK